MKESKVYSLRATSDKIFLLAPFPQLARAVSSRGALKRSALSSRQEDALESSRIAGQGFERVVGIDRFDNPAEGHAARIGTHDQVGHGAGLR